MRASRAIGLAISALSGENPNPPVTSAANHHRERRAMIEPQTRPAYWFAAICVLMLVAGCAFDGLSINQHYSTYAARLPEKNTIFVCSAYACRTQTEFKFTAKDIAKLQALMAEPQQRAGLAQERLRIGHTLAWMEKRVGDVVGTSADRPGDDFRGRVIRRRWIAST